MTDYERGLVDAWDCARWILSRQSVAECCAIDRYFETERPIDIFEKYSALCAITMMRVYRESDSIEIGDEVEYEGVCYIVVNKFNTGVVDCVNKRGAVNGIDLFKCTKTGRNFPELIEILSKVGDDYDEDDE